jgi:HTH-type transcriptional regulator/antitoxin HigA
MEEIIVTEANYDAIMARIEELLPLMEAGMPMDDPNMIELDRLSDLIITFDEERCPIKAPTRLDIIQLRLEELGIRIAAFWRAHFSIHRHEIAGQARRVL